MKKKLNKLAEILTEMGLYGESEHIQKISQTLPDMGGKPVTSPYKTEGYQVKVDSQSPHRARYMGPKSKRKRSDCNPSWSVEKCNAWIEEAPYRDPRTGVTDEEKALSSRAPSPDPTKAKVVEPEQRVLKRTQRPWLRGCRKYPNDEKTWMQAHKAFGESFMALSLSFSDAWDLNISILPKNFTVNHGEFYKCLMEQLKDLSLPGPANEGSDLLPYAIDEDRRPSIGLADLIYPDTGGQVNWVWNNHTKQFELEDHRLIHESCPSGNCHAANRPATNYNWNDLSREGPVFNMQRRPYDPKTLWLTPPPGYAHNEAYHKAPEWPEQLLPEKDVADYRGKILELSWEIQDLFGKFDRLEKKTGTQLSAGADARSTMYHQATGQAKKIRRLHKALVEPAKRIRPWQYHRRHVLPFEIVNPPEK